VYEKYYNFTGIPFQQQPDEINTHHGGRGVYFFDPAGHGLELITQPYL